MIGRPASSPADWSYIEEHLPPLIEQWPDLTWSKLSRWCATGGAHAGVFEHQGERRGFMVYHLDEDALFVSGMYFEPGCMLRHQSEIWGIVKELTRRCGVDRFSFRTSRAGWKRVRELGGRIISMKPMVDYTVSVEG